MFATKRTQDAVPPDQGLVAQARAMMSETRPALVPTLISTDFVVRGTLTSTGEIQIDGRLEGDATCSRLVIGEGASVTGKITADTVELRGRVQGEIRARDIRLGPACHVEADLIYGTLIVEDGAVFAGTCRRMENPRSEDAPKDNGLSQRLAVVHAPVPVVPVPIAARPPGAVHANAGL